MQEGNEKFHLHLSVIIYTAQSISKVTQVIKIKQEVITAWYVTHLFH